MDFLVRGVLIRQEYYRDWLNLKAEQKLLETNLQVLLFFQTDWQVKGINFFLLEVLHDLLESVPLSRKNRMWLHHYGVFPYNFLTENAMNDG